MTASGSADAAFRISRAKSAGKAMSLPWAPPDHHLNKPIHSGPAFELQTTRAQAVYGKMRLPESSLAGGRDWYDGAHPTIGRSLINRPRTGAVGVPFAKQLTRKEAVYGKLLTDVAMTRMLLGTSWSQGGGQSAEVEVLSTTFLRPPLTRKRTNIGQHQFNKQIGRVEYYEAGLRGAPAKPNLGERKGDPRNHKMQAQADARNPRAASAPPLRNATAPVGLAAAKGGAKMNPFASLIDIPQRLRPHVLVPDMSRQIGR
ncbi:hypothetical protein T492DRAFT_899074 [Pavlovales sp. CCMP2436]|nr:hypothetical protein T492DRAFT_899074 [Pavlovales sp. CCMP2436]